MAWLRWLVHFFYADEPLVERARLFTISTGTKKISEDYYRISSCDYNFKVGEKYLVYARVTDDNQLVARSCTRTNLLPGGEADTPELDILSPGAYHAPPPPAVSWMTSCPHVIQVIVDNGDISGGAK
jgi:hypothetical protein